jgi:2-polyprenyl-3-methyl-5-hydroxy-6-metoxy-1,4-benzoquinol methylase
MIDKIKKIHSETTFDFRVFSNPKDELSYLFHEWIPYYKMKYAICKVINPQSILEVGVRYGYSAITFLNASPDASYLGIDNDTNSFGGTKGAIEWAKKITAEYKTNFLIADTQEMTKFPGEFYDLIHIDGQQDGDGTFHDLELALHKGQWILLDGYFWSRENMLSATYFLEKYKQFIEYAIIIPSYAGDLLIKTKDSVRNIRISGDNFIDQTIREGYDKTYFLQSCGGYDSFKRHKGLKLEAPALLAIYYIAISNKSKRILDVGCGRGELSFALSCTGADVTAIDYSKDAIDIAEKTYEKEKKDRKLQFFHADFLKCPFDDHFDLIIASDFIEHIEQNTLDQIVKKISTLLESEGIAVFHTAPNRLYYDNYYPTLRQRAKKAGTYLPKNPRTYYEDLMHINEQTPDGMKNLLEKYFHHVVVWVTGDYDMIGSLAREFNSDEVNESRGIFAVASNAQISKKSLLAALTREPITTDPLCITIKVNSDLTTLPSQKRMQIPISIKNSSKEELVSLPPNPVHISYHWAEENGKIVIFEGIRTPILIPILPNEVRECLMDLITPNTKGKYQLQITLVQELCFWFEPRVKELPVCIDITIND